MSLPQSFLVVCVSFCFSDEIIRSQLIFCTNTLYSDEFHGNRATDIFLIFFPSTALTLGQTTSFYKQPLEVLLTLSGCQENKFFSVATEDVLAHNHLVKYTFKYSVYYPCSGPTTKSTNSGGYPMLNLSYIAQ